MKEEDTQRKKAKVKTTSEIYKGRIFDFITEELTLPNGRQMTWMPSSWHPAGVYFARLRGEDVSDVVKYTVLR